MQPFWNNNTQKQTHWRGKHNVKCQRRAGQQKQQQTAVKRVRESERERQTARKWADTTQSNRLGAATNQMAASQRRWLSKRLRSNSDGSSASTQANTDAEFGRRQRKQLVQLDFCCAYVRVPIEAETRASDYRLFVSLPTRARVEGEITNHTHTWMYLQYTHSHMYIHTMYNLINLRLALPVPIKVTNTISITITITITDYDCWFKWKCTRDAVQCQILSIF